MASEKQHSRLSFGRHTHAHAYTPRVVTPFVLHTHMNTHSVVTPREDTPFEASFPSRLLSVFLHFPKLEGSFGFDRWVMQNLEQLEPWLF